MVVNVEASIAAENVGILLGDILIGFDGRELADINDIVSLLNDKIIYRKKG
ncbi:hypothetical protein [Rivularia sp. UHCC 0363]|uniref:hypothetical protein n=1 Tax=Rivularia sp. UHCC 0363 TaxID=3110244 RepID=UPI002B20B176|nr:hypothetical protein [Rivularia sp. UHCC 0363]MEA5598430.1 hypothetical protein [Rivularia sp. UHCC 0363]